MRDWIKYELAVFNRAGRHTWRALRPSSWGDALRGGVIVAVTIAALYIGGNAALAVEEITLQWAALYGLLAAIAGTFLFNLALAPYRIDWEKSDEFQSTVRRLEANVSSLEDQLCIYTQRPEDMEKISIEEAITMLPDNEITDLLQNGAYKQKFSVFGREMHASYKTNAGHYIIQFDTGTRQEKQIGWPYFENGVFVLDGPRATEVPVDGPFKPYTGKDDAYAQTLYTDLKIGKDQFDEFVKSLNRNAE